MKKLIHLTGAVAIPTEEAQEKIKKAIQGGGIYRDTHGRTVEDYEDLNMPLPKDFYDNKEDSILEIDGDGMVELEEGDVEHEAVAVTIPLDNLSSWVENSNFGSKVYTKDGVYYDVFDDVDEIDDMWYFLHLSWFERQKLYFKVFMQKFARVKNK